MCLDFSSHCVFSVVSRCLRWWIFLIWIKMFRPRWAIFRSITVGEKRYEVWWRGRGLDDRSDRAYRSRTVTEQWHRKICWSFFPISQNAIADKFAIVFHSAAKPFFARSTSRYCLRPLVITVLSCKYCYNCFHASNIIAFCIIYVWYCCVFYLYTTVGNVWILSLKRNYFSRIVFFLFYTFLAVIIFFSYSNFREKTTESEWYNHGHNVRLLSLIK